jgi:DsbC/DsbD-like thiol-disulfide interchange protein
MVSYHQLAGRQPTVFCRCATLRVGGGRPTHVEYSGAGRGRFAMACKYTLPPSAIGMLVLFALGLSSGTVRAAATNWDRRAHGAARLITATKATGSGTNVDIGLQLQLTPGWHTYWRMPGDAGIAPTIDWQGSDNLARATIAWPEPQRLPPLGGVETIGYMDGVTLPVTITLARPGVMSAL